MPVVSAGSLIAAGRGNFNLGLCLVLFLAFPFLKSGLLPLLPSLDGFSQSVCFMWGGLNEPQPADPFLDVSWVYISVAPAL